MIGKLRRTLRRHAGAFLADNGFRALSRLGQLHPHARPERHGVVVERDIPYLDDGQRDHLLDVYRPALDTGRHPVVLYVHGGGFRILSKDTHWIMGLAFARRGYVVFNINYRLAPKHRFPVPLEDAAAALVWVHRNAHRWGGDPSRLVIAGESAGGNLAASLAVATAYRRPEPFARAIFDAGVRAVAAAPSCAILQVSDTARFGRRKPKLSPFIGDRLDEVERAYLGPSPYAGPGGLDLADPVVVLERGLPPDRPLPPFFAICGTRDPLLDDTRRLATALSRLGVRCEARYYPGEVHAFHALVWRRNARRSWRDKFSFLSSCVECGEDLTPSAARSG